MTDAFEPKKSKRDKSENWDLVSTDDLWGQDAKSSKSKKKKISENNEDNLGLIGKDAKLFDESKAILIDKTKEKEKRREIQKTDDDSIDLSKINVEQAEVQKEAHGDFEFDPTFGGEFMKAEKHGLSKHHRRVHQITWVHKEAESKAAQVEKEVKELKLKKIATRQKYGW
eukprot:GDKJ01019973.1.p1 GENE.GDKJ01019973.1~~GDKJ01019973.1.p1  ORF type:complete len:170 (-),score=45.64 GDKJ01019973.1:129-638(-)